MSLQMILGGSGTGKSYKLYDMVIHDAQTHPDQKIWMLVPEQYTMQTQKELVNRHPNHCVTNIDIVSFERLAYRIFDELGIVPDTILDDAGKSMIIRRILSAHQDELFAFRGNIRKKGFVEQVKSMISELLQYGISPETLHSILENTSISDKLRSKLKDIEHIYSAFLTFIDKKYITTEEVLGLLVRVIDQSQLIKNTHIYLDNFTGFTPVQYELMAHLLRLTSETVMTLTIARDCLPYEKPIKEELFFLTKETLSRVKNICTENSIPQKKDMWMTNESINRFSECAELSFFESSFLRSPNKRWTKPISDIHIVTATNPDEEMHYTARMIHKLVIEHQYSYQEIAVITSDVECYRYSAMRWFEKYDIPCFFDSRRNISGNMMIEWLRSLLNMLIFDFQDEKVVRYLRCGLSSLSREQADLLEDYIFAYGIRRSSRWKKEWKSSTSEYSEEELNELNSFRESLITSISDLFKLSKRKTIPVRLLIQTLYKFMQLNDIRGRLQTQAAYFEEKGDLSREKEYDQIYDVIIAFFEKTSALLGDEEMTLREFLDTLEAGIADVQLGIIPPGIDQVTFGDVRRTRLDHIQVLFFTGMNDGLVPMVTHPSDLITDAERELLSELKIQLAPTVKENLCTERFYLYSCLTKPSDQLIISYSKQNMSGQEMHPSIMITQIQKLFPALEIQKAIALNEVWDIQDGWNQIIDGLRTEAEGKSNDHEWHRTMKWFYDQSEYKDFISTLIDAAFYHHDDQKLSQAAVKAVYGNHLSGGVTMLERYAACAYAHFLTYGLKLKERQVFQVRAVDIGRIFHEAVELFSDRISHSPEQWRTISDSQRTQLVSECVKSVILQYRDELMKDTKRAEYLTDRIEQMTQRTIWALQQQLKKGDFDPEAYEMNFETSFENTTSLDTDTELSLKGTIDRLDTCQDGESELIRIIDYKTGKTAYDLSAVYYGLQMQLMVYMKAAYNKKNLQYDSKKLIIPAGILYYHIDDPFLSSSSFEQLIHEDIKDGELTDDELNIMKLLTMDGLIVADDNVIHHMDHKPDQAPQIIPVKYKKDGQLTKQSSVISADMFSDMIEYVNTYAESVGKSIFSGAIPVNPYAYGTKTPCQFCSYNSICGFDSKIDGYTYRKLRKMSDDEIWMAIKKKKGGN